MILARSWALVVLLLTIYWNASESLRILGIFPLQGKSHFVMSESLMRGLAERGHQVDVYSHFPLKKPPPNYVDYSLAGSLPAFSNNMSYQFMNTFASNQNIAEAVDVIGHRICDLLGLPIFQKLIRSPPKYDLVIVETFLSECYFAFGRHLNIPMINLGTNPLLPWMNHALGNPQNLAEEFAISTDFFGRLKDFLFTTYFVNSFNYYVRIQNNHVKKYFGLEFPSILDLRKDVSLALINYHHELHGIRALVPAVVPVGFLHIADSDDNLAKGVEKFLDESKDGFIYFSFGSMVRIETFPKPVLDAFYATFKKIAPIRVLMKIAKPEELPAELPSNVMTYHWLPQTKVLKHKNIKAFVTHGGLMGTQEAIYYGVPMIGFPLFGDQHNNINAFVVKKLAIKLDQSTITEPVFTKAVEEILWNPVYRESAKKVGDVVRDVPLKPIDKAVFWIEYVSRHGKDCLRSPIVDLPWWQTSLIDIYAFTALVVLAVLYVIKIVVVKIIYIIRPKQCPMSNEKLKRS